MLEQRSAEQSSTAQAGPVGSPPVADGKLPWSTPVTEEVLGRECDAILREYAGVPARNAKTTEPTRLAAALTKAESRARELGLTDDDRGAQ